MQRDMPQPRLLRNTRGAARGRVSCAPKAKPHIAAAEKKNARPTHKKTHRRVFLFSSESVNEGHPDKLADQVSDAVLDACLKQDPYSKVACETATKDNMVMVFGEITTDAKLDYDKIVRNEVQKIGFDSFEDDLSSVDSKGLSCDSCEVLVRINKQSPDIAGGVHVGKSDLDVGAGDQGIMFGYASDETESCMPLTHLMATKLGKTLTDVRKDGSLWWLRPDGKTQVTIKYNQNADGSVEPSRSTPSSSPPSTPSPSRRRARAPPSSIEEQDGKDNRPEVHRQGADRPVDGGHERAHPRQGHRRHARLDHPQERQAGHVDLRPRDTCNLHINPSGKFIIGGPQGDAGLTGRKIIIDTYGGWGAHGGGAFSGKDPTKVDRSAAYACRWMAKSVVKSGLCKRAFVQLSYAIGVAKPLSLFVETYGTENGNLTAKAITNIVKINFDARPGALARDLALRQPKYNVTAAYCHFGREPYTKDGIRYFSWEDPIDLSKYGACPPRRSRRRSPPTRRRSSRSGWAKGSAVRHRRAVEHFPYPRAPPPLPPARPPKDRRFDRRRLGVGLRGHGPVA